MSASSLISPFIRSSPEEPVPITALPLPIKPPSRLGMVKLQRSAFYIYAEVLSAVVEAPKLGKLLAKPAVKGSMIDMTKVKVLEDYEKQLGGIPVEKGLKVVRFYANKEEDLSEEARALLKDQIRGYVTEVIRIGYDSWTAAEILGACLPTDEHVDIPSSFTTTGHIGHMNIREKWWPYKSMIARVILDKNPALRTVVNKLDTINTTYRYFDMEVLAGDEDYITTVNESNCQFTFDFSRVYWNSRLSGEHNRLCNLFAPNSLIADAMAGVGPFAIPAAKKGCYVLANDLNPDSSRWMITNVAKNKVEERVRVTNDDAMEWIRKAPLTAWTERFTVPEPVVKPSRRKKDVLAPIVPHALPPPPAPAFISNFVMNLPDSALSFLPAYIGCFTPLLSSMSFMEACLSTATAAPMSPEDVPMPMVHCYCFTKEIEFEPAQKDILTRASGYLEWDLTPQAQDYELHFVRRVSPSKDMYCLSFRLPREVAWKPQPELPPVEGENGVVEPRPVDPLANLTPETSAYD
ncbi:hypothetical protein IAT38_006966 [Cryptococcus sp. DSM 104549]